MTLHTSLMKLIGENQVVVVATADKEGSPHLAAAKGLTVIGDDLVAFKNWFCFQTLRNIAENPNVALSLFGPDGEHGFQLIGKVVESRTDIMLDGYIPETINGRAEIPQTHLQLLVKVERILELSTGPHSDEHDIS